MRRSFKDAQRSRRRCRRRDQSPITNTVFVQSLAALGLESSLYKIGCAACLSDELERASVVEPAPAATWDERTNHLSNWSTQYASRAEKLLSEPAGAHRAIPSRSDRR